MTFKSFSTLWVVVTIVAGLISFLLNQFFPTHTMWPFGIGFLYVGVLVFFLAKLLSK